MKKILCFVLVFTFMLCGCQKPSEDNAEQTDLYHKYENIISALEDEDYEKAMEIIRGMNGNAESDAVTSSTPSEDPSSEEVSSVEETSSVEESSTEISSDSTAKHGKVTITLDNWDEYFEFATVEKWEENAFGEATRLTFLYYFQPKEEYADKIRTNVNFNLAVEYTCTTTTGLDPIPATLDYENRTYSLGEFPSKTLNLRRDFKFKGNPENVGHYARVLGDELYEYCWDFKVTRIEGSIYLK